MDDFDAKYTKPLLDDGYEVQGATLWLPDPEPIPEDEDDDWPCGECVGNPFYDREPWLKTKPECACGKPMCGPFRGVICWKEQP